MDETAGGWERLATAVRSRRLDIGHDLKAFVAISGVSARTVQAVEYAERTGFNATTKHRLEKALYWAPGSIDRTVAGGEPVELPLPAPEESPLSKLGTAEIVARISESLTELVRRVPPDVRLDDDQDDEYARVDDYVPGNPAQWDGTALPPPPESPRRRQRA